MELTGLSIKYWPACRFNEPPLVGVITECSADGVAKLAVFPDYDGGVRMIQTAYRRGDRRLSTASGAVSEAAMKWGCWDLTESSKQLVKCATECCAGK